MNIGSDKSRACGTVFVSSAIGAGAESPRVCGVDRHVEVIAVDLLKPCKVNARTHSRKQIRQIADSITRFGFCNPVLIDDGNQIIAGHGRAEAAKLLGLNEVPALRLSHLSATEKRAYVIADNRLAELAGWDHDTLAIELQGLIELDFAVEITGFDVGEIDLILGDRDKDRNDSAGAEAKLPKATSGSAISQAGDLWRLGHHQLVCGNGGDARSYAAIDAAIQRWQSCSGNSATLAGSGQTFKEIEQQRRKARRASGPAVAPSSEAA